ncbi:uncharacterized protein MYCFIDRAFT_209568 [Pseudocercospora fijiensis CIRAD86]|uniref:Uncharacterized protein n=1 Tax=Pseudocercospora fijiensis (strain CIRAD86) TaxID=383855 RepID=N1Q7M4_PSEFD|nr:uncharacterized protein MYCFIDRAFT_209568 [Pseudocercospora fijiensis CIRAD86]EME87646.1 hypothetical protein MYCFIDRAFT_209568 [Pseudocercospora fijiensis CIRAD86]
MEVQNLTRGTECKQRKKLLRSKATSLARGLHASRDVIIAGRCPASKEDTVRWRFNDGVTTQLKYMRYPISLATSLAYLQAAYEWRGATAFAILTKEC